MDGTLGRTNRAFPPVWLALAPPRDPGELDALVGAARDANVPLDVSTLPGLWGGKMRGDDERFFVLQGTAAYENATEHAHATDLLQAHLIETLSALGREWVDVYFLRVRRPVEEFQMDGALEALETARQDGHIRYLGLLCDGPGLSALAMWQFHDAFELLLLPRSPFDEEAYRTLTPLARERRVGVVTHRPYDAGFGLDYDRLAVPSPSRREVLAWAAADHPVIAPVASTADVAAALEPLPAIEGLDARLAPARAAAADEATWAALLAAGDPAARRRERSR